MRLVDWQNDLQRSIQFNLDSNLLAIKTGRLSRETRLGIYQFAYPSRLEEALRTNFPALHQLLGDEDFSTLNKKFLQTYPPQEASIRWYGNRLADFLQETSPYQTLPIFSELARFEWALRHTIDAPNARRLCAEELKSLQTSQWGALHFALHPSMSLLKFEWNTVAVWQALMSGETPPSPSQEKTCWLVWRGKDGMSEWRSASELEWQALQAVQNQATFTEVCERTARDIEAGNNTIMQVATWIHTWIAQEFLCLTDAL